MAPAASKTSKKIDALHYVLIDAANTLYRAFFALPPMRNPAGEPTNAVLGFANMLQKVIREEQPDCIAVVFDAPGETFRHEIFPEYKAGRDKQAEELTQQFPMARELTELYGFPMLMVEGVEADDVIATLVETVPKDASVTIISTDKDLMQLVSERVNLLDTMKDRRYDPAAVEERFGVPPELLLDMRALVGDPSDNIPGVKGIGQKGAANLINEWGSLETLLEHADEVKAKRAREALQTLADDARLSKTLSTLRKDLSLPVTAAELKLRDPDVEALRARLAHLGFKRLLAKLDEEQAGEEGTEAPAKTSAPQQVDVEIIDDAKGLASLVKKLKKTERVSIVPVLPEVGLMQEPLVGLAFSLAAGKAAYIPLAHRFGEAQGAMDLLGSTQLQAAEVVQAIAPLLTGKMPKLWTASDAKSVSTAFGELGTELPPACFDLTLAGFLIDAGGSRLPEALALTHLDRTLQSWEALAGKGAKAVPAALLDIKQVGAWAAEQVDVLAQLYVPMREKIDADGLSALLDDIEMPLTAVLSRMERVGVRIDKKLLGKLSVEYEASLIGIEKDIFELAGEEFKVSSPKQLQVILFEKLGLKPSKKTKTGYSTDEGVLQELVQEHPLPERVLAFRHLSKLKSTYVDALPRLVNERTGRIHPTLLQTGAATGRLSCLHPNLQNIPIRTDEGSRIRSAFIPAEGKNLLCADYSQVELRILAHYSEDESLLDAFQNGEDVHRRTAAEVLGIDPVDVTAEDRAQAKAVNFGIVYGSSAFGLSNQLGIPVYAAQQYIESYFERYQGVRRFLDECLEEATKNEYVVTLLGRRRYLPDLNSRNRVQRQAAERMAVNTVVQGTAADLIKKAMVAVDRRLVDEGLSAQMILQVHDELMLEVSEDEEAAVRKLLTEEMENVWELRVPLRIDIGVGENWRVAH